MGGKEGFRFDPNRTGGLFWALFFAMEVDGSAVAGFGGLDTFFCHGSFPRR